MKKILSIAWFSSHHYSVSCESVLLDISEPHLTTWAWAVTALLSLGGSPGRGGARSGAVTVHEAFSATPAEV